MKSDAEFTFPDGSKKTLVYKCHDNDRIWYPPHGSSENRWQNDYINMYYEKKEKFGKN